MLDGYGRDIKYLRVSVTDRCNLRCVYCMPEEGIDKKLHKDILRYEDILKIVKAAISLGINKVRYTGGEPLVLKDIDKLIYETSRLSGVDDIAITTNGILLFDMVDDLKKAGLKRVNISLDTLDKQKFRNITRVGDLDRVLMSIDRCIKLGLLPVKINTVLMKGINDDEIPNFIRLTNEMPIELRFIELMPIGEGTRFYENCKMTSKEVLERHPELIHIETNKKGTAELYKIPGAKGKVGFISPMSCKFCADCNRVRLTSTGTIKPCLHSEEEFDLKKYLNDEVMLREALRAAILNKPLEHHLVEEKTSRTVRLMHQIGG